MAKFSYLLSIYFRVHLFETVGFVWLAKGEETGCMSLSSCLKIQREEKYDLYLFM